MALFDTQLAMLANQASNALISGRGPAAAGQYPPQYRALPAVRHRRSADHHRHRQQPPVRAARRDLRASGVDQRSAVRRPMARGSPIARRWLRLIAAVIAGKPAAEWLDQLEAAGIPAGPINRDQPGVGRRPGGASRGWCGRSPGCRWSDRRSASMANAPTANCRRPRSASIRAKLLKGLGITEPGRGPA